MRRPSILLLSIILSVIFLIIVIMLYFGYDRYLMLKINPLRRYVENYRELPKIGGRKKRVVLSVAVPFSDAEEIKELLKSILDQTFRVDQIALNVPYELKDKIPSEYLKFVNIYKTNKKFGRGNYIMPTLTREGEKDTIIIFVNENKILGDDFVETMFVESEKTPQEAIYLVTKGVCDAVLVKPSFFDVSVVDYSRKYLTNKWIDDNLKCRKRKIEYMRNICL